MQRISVTARLNRSTLQFEEAAFVRLESYLAEAARTAGAEVTIAPVYQTLPAETLDPVATDLLRNGEIDFVTFASSSSVRNFVEALGPAEAQTLLAGAVIGCMGPVTASTAHDLGLRVDIVPEEHTIEALVLALAQHYATVPRRLDA